MLPLSPPWETSIVEYQEEASPLKGFRNHRDILQEQASAPPLLSSLLPGDQKALPKVVRCHWSTGPGRSNPSEREASPLAFLPLFLCLVFSKCSVFPYFPFSSRFPWLSWENSGGLTPSSASFFLAAVMLLALRFPSGEKGHLWHTST